MLRAVGFDDDDFEKPIIAVANAHSTITPCNAGLNRLAGSAFDALQEAGTMPQIFGTITVSDGISQGTEGMKYSLVSREVIADSIETVCQAQSVDGLLAIGACDKNMPGAMMAIARLNIPAIFIYGGTIKPGYFDDEDLTIVSAFEAVGQYCAGKISEDRLIGIERNACPGIGSCGGMFTANTMSAAIEAMGLSLPFSSTMSAEDGEIVTNAIDSAEVLVQAVQNELLPRQLLTRKAFENAITVVMAVGGSTNAVLHLLAIAHAAQVELTLDDFEKIRKRVPVICDLKPSGLYVTTDLHTVGGIPRVMKVLLTRGLLHGDALTITGQSIEETLARVPENPDKKQDVIRQWNEPLYPEGHLVILRGNLASEGAVAKVSGVRSKAITGPARVFDSEESCLHAILSSEIKAGDVVVEFDGATLERTVQEKASELKQAQAEIGQTTAQARITQEQNATALMKAKYDIDRAKLDVNKGETVSRIENEQAKLALGDAEQKLRELESRMTSDQAGAEADLSAKQRKREKALFDMKRARQGLANLQLRAPAAGMVNILPNFRSGGPFGGEQEFRAGDRAWPGAAILELPDLSSIHLEARLDESDRGRLAVGQEASVRIEAVPGREFKARIDRISVLARVDFSSGWPPTRNFDLDLVLTDVDPRIRPGMSAVARIATERVPDVLVVPAASVFQQNGHPVVYRLDGSAFEERRIEVARRGREQAVVASGLAPGDRVASRRPEPGLIRRPE